MKTVKIISDSTCDLTGEQREKFGISIIPLHVILGENSYADGVNITPAEIVEWVEKTKETPKTAAPTPEEIAEVFQRELKDYQEIVCFSIAGGMSSTNSDMHVAAQMLGAEEQIHIIDSANLSSGLGLLVLEAAEMADAGADGRTIVEHIEKQKPLVRASFVVDTLMYLYRGGRCSGLTAVAGETLKLHPKISVIEGEMKAGKKYRGSMSRVIMKYAREMEDELLKAQPKRVFITYSPCDPQMEKEVREYLESLNYFEEICSSDAGSVVTSHCGPGTMGVLFLAKG